MKPIQLATIGMSLMFVFMILSIVVVENDPYLGLFLLLGSFLSIVVGMTAVLIGLGSRSESNQTKTN